MCFCWLRFACLTVLALLLFAWEAFLIALAVCLTSDSFMFLISCTVVSQSQNRSRLWDAGTSRQVPRPGRASSQQLLRLLSCQSSGSGAHYPSAAIGKISSAGVLGLEPGFATTAAFADIQIAEPLPRKIPSDIAERSAY